MAWLVDSLREEGRDNELTVILGNANILSLSSSAVGGFVSGLIAEHSLELPFAVGACSAFSASLLALYWTRSRGEIFESRKKRYREFLKKGACVIIKSKLLVLLTVGSFFIALRIPNFTLTWAPYMEDQELVNGCWAWQVQYLWPRWG
ncbi:MAG: hypothetical protein J7L38_04910 [Thermoproteales archaeon]|nr:hypothetical protein [Thermoproteales archaeon]